MKFAEVIVGICVFGLFGYMVLGFLYALVRCFADFRTCC